MNEPEGVEPKGRAQGHNRDLTNVMDAAVVQVSDLWTSLYNLALEAWSVLLFIAKFWNFSFLATNLFHLDVSKKKETDVESMED